MADTTADAPAKPASPMARITTSVCLGYGAGTLGQAILLNAVTTYFPALMATVLGQSPATAGLLLTLSKLYDIVADFVIGDASDRTNTRWGRRRPYLLAGAVVGSLSFFAIFTPPSLNGPFVVAYMAIMLVIYSTGYSLFTVPYTAMVAEMTDDYDERTRLMSFRTVFSAGGQLLALAGAAALVKYGGAGEGGFRLMGAVLGLVIAAALLWCFLGTAKAPFAKRVETPPIKVREQIRMIIENKQFLIYMAAKFLQFISLASVTSTGLLFKLNVLKIGYEGQIQLSVVQNLVMAFSMPVWVWMGKRYGKRNCYMFALGLNAAAYISWLFTGPGITPVEVMGRGVVLGIAAGGVILMALSMLPDIMEYDRRLHGVRREGLFSSLYSIMEKVGYAIGPAAIGLYLAASGYISTTKGQLVQQGPGAIQALYVSNAVIPAAAMIGSIILMLFYKLDKATLARHAAADQNPV